VDPRDWRKVEAWFHAALQLPEDEREAFVTEASGGRPDLGERVRAMLESEDGDSPLDRPVFTEALLTTHGPSLVGRRVGAFELVELIDTGGMGAVYRGRRADGEFRKHVAVKLLRGSWFNAAGAERFQRERQALAQLEHPYIARLLDGGTTEDGLPYLVMDYVQGKAVDLWADEHELTISERLLLFRKICSAVDHAHKNLVVHRDIKPANILVTAEGEPKLLDFGIAKILEDNPEVTRATQRFLTPEYSSPEQLRGQAVTTSADVYSLGVLLFRLLTGRRPFESGTRPSHELAREICEEEPARPSAMVLSREDVEGAPSPESIARRRKSTPARLRRQLRGDLEIIVLAALRKEPTRRYSSVERLSEDVRLYLQGLPISAREDNWFYRATKFTRRNLVACVAASLIVVLVVAAAVVTTVEARRAERAAAGYRRALTHVAGMVAALDPKRRSPFTAHEIRDRADELAALLDETIDEGEQEEHVEVMETLAGTYHSLGLRTKARPWVLAVYDVRRHTLPPDSIEMAEAMAAVHSYLPDPLERVELASRSLEILRRHLSEPHVDLARGIRRLATALPPDRDRDTERLLVESIEMLRRLDPVPYEVLARHQLQLASRVYWQDRRDYEESRRTLEQAMRSLDQVVEEDTLHALALRTMACLLQDTQRYADAFPFMSRALDILNERLPEDHPNVCYTLTVTALLLKDMGRFEQAAEVSLRALASAEAFGEDPVDLARMRVGMAKVLCDKGDYAEAVTETSRALVVLRSDEEWLLEEAVGLTLLGRARNGMGDCAGAVSVLEEALEISRRLRRDDWEVAKTRNLLGEALTGLGRFEEAEGLLLESFPLIQEDRGPTQHRTTQAMVRIIDHYEARGMSEEAGRWREHLADEALASPIVRRWLEMRAR